QRHLLFEVGGKLAIAGKEAAVTGVGGEPFVEGEAVRGGHGRTVELGGPQGRLFFSGRIGMFDKSIHDLASFAGIECATGGEDFCGAESASRKSRSARACCFSTVLTAMPSR